MKKDKKVEPTEKKDLHPRNRHRSRYDLKQLVASSPDLSEFVFTDQYSNETIDFSNPDAVKILNKALLKQFYGVANWDIPENYLCPPVPGRADYIHYIADLLAASNENIIPRGESVTCLDIGVGANCIYPIIGNYEYGWRFVGTDVDNGAVQSAKKIVESNHLKSISIRKQSDPGSIFKGMIKPGERFDAVICNPPFHSSAAEAQEGTLRKVRNLNSGKRSKVVLNFGGQHNELWCAGGEKTFVSKMIRESSEIPDTCFWFSSMISKSAHLETIYYELDKVKALQVKTIEMKQGNKISRIVAWTFLNTEQQVKWRKERWTTASA